MHLNLGLGPVFKFECLSTSRRWQYFAGRVLFIGILLAALSIVVWSVEKESRGPVSLRTMAAAGETFYSAIVGTQLALLFLIAPAVTADAICLDKARGALLPLLTTDLNSREIILGKLFARFLPIFGFVICGLPVLAICLTLGGIHPEFIFGATLVCLGVALVGGTAALVLSVFCTKTYEVLLVCYLLWIFYLLLFPLSFLLPAWVPTGWAKYGNPLYLCFAPYTSPGSVAISDFLYFLVGCIGLSALLTIVAIVGLRRVVIRQGAVATKRRTRRWWRMRIPSLPGPSLDGNPVLWREWHRQRPSRWVRFVWAMYTLAAFGFSLYCVLQCVFGLKDPNSDVVGILVNAFQVPVGLLLVSITSVTSLQDERVRDSLDVLLTTPLSTAQIYWGKWWGSYRIVFFLAALPTFVAAGPGLRQCWEQGGWPTAVNPMDWYFLLMPVVVCCYGSAVVTIGLALAIWIKRAGRAMATSVVVFIFLTVGLLFAPLIQDGPDRTILMGSSFLASGFLTEDCLRPFHRPEPTVPVLMLWCIFYTLVAATISLAACRSFDRCLGRMPDKMPRRFVPERAVRRLQRRAETSEPATLVGGVFRQ